MADVSTATFRAVADFSQLRKEAASGEDALDRVGRAADKAGSDTAKGMGDAAGGIAEAANQASLAERVMKGFGSAVVSAGGAIASAFGHAVVAGVQAVGTALAVGGAAAAGFAVHATLTAARVEELNGVLAALARVSGVSYDEMQKQVAGVRASGIEAAVAQGLIATLVRANIDLSQATTLARVAQDAAVFSGQNSSDVLAQLTDGIETQNTLILRNAGLQVDVNSALDDYAKKLGKATTDLTGAERQQAVMNAVLVEGAKIAGAYATAMESPSKVLRSLPRLFDDIAVNVGQSFLPVFGDLIFSAYDTAKALSAATVAGQPLRIIIDGIGQAVRDLLEPLSGLGDRFASALSQLTVDRATRIADAVKNISPALLAVLAALVTLGGSGLPIIGEFISPWLALAVAVGAFVLKSEAAQEALAPLLRMFADMGERVMPLLLGIIQRLTPMIESIIGYITAYGHVLIEAFERFINVVGPTLNLIFEVLGETIEQLIPVIFPLIDVLLRVGAAILDVLGEALAAVAPIVVKLFEALGPVIALLGDVFIEVLRALLPIFLQLVRAIEPLIPILGDALLTILKALAPIIPIIAEVLGQLAKVFAEILKAVAPLIPPLAQLIAHLIERLLPFLPQLVEAGLGLLQMLLPLLPTFVKLAEAVLKLLDALMPLIDLVMPIIIAQLSLFTLGAAPLIEILAKLATFLATVLTGAIEGVTWVIEHLGEIVSWLGDQFSVAFEWIKQAAVDVKDWIVQAFNDVIDFLSGVPGKIVAFFAGLGGKIVDAIGDLVGLISGLFQRVLDFVAGIPGKIVDFFSTLPGKIVGVLIGLPALVVGVFVGLPGMIMAAVGGLVGMWFDLGVKMASAIISGLGNIASRIAGIVGDIAGFVGGAFGGIDAQVNELRRKAQEAADLAGIGYGGGGDTGSGGSGSFDYDTYTAPVDYGVPQEYYDPYAYTWYARGGIVTADEELARLHGPEVVIPLNDAARALQLAEQSGLMALLASNAVRVQASTPDVSTTGTSPLGGMSPTFHIYETDDPEVTADITLRRLTMAVNRT